MDLEYKSGYFPTDSGCISRSKIVAKAVIGSSTAISTEQHPNLRDAGVIMLCMNPLGIEVVEL